MNDIVKLNMFSCGHCEYQIASTKIMDIHNRTFHDKVKKYNCDVCGQQVLHKNILARQKKIVHEGIKFPCRQCNYQSTTKGSLAEHTRAVHEGVKYPCIQCGKQLTNKSYLVRHQMTVHAGQSLSEVQNQK